MLLLLLYTIKITILNVYELCALNCAASLLTESNAKDVATHLSKKSFLMK